MIKFKTLLRTELSALPSLIGQGYEMLDCTSDAIQLSLKGESVANRCFIGVGGIIRQGSKFLLVQEANGFLRGKWGFPSGLMNEGESISQGVEREVMEETGLCAKFTNI